MERKHGAFSTGILAAFLLLVVCSSHASEIKDSESAAHGFDAASVSVVETYAFSGFKVIQFDLPVLSVYSYMLVSDNKALVIDPVRDMDVYLQAAEKNKLDIVGVYLSHSHADFVAGHMELVRVLKCPIYQSAKSGVKYTIHALANEETFTVGNASLTFIDTPGHTPDGGCLLAFEKDHLTIPKVMFTGDVLFVGSVGRPDLMGGTASPASLASAMFDSWNNKLSKMDDSVIVLPAHGAGSLCGAHLSDDPSSTIGRERLSNTYLQHTSRGSFIAAVLEGIPEAPQYFKYNAQMNKEGPPLVDWKAPLSIITAPNKTWTDPKKAYVVDVRTAEAYARGHIPNAVNIGVRGRMETWVGIMIPWQAKLILTGEEKELRESQRRLHRVGYRPVFVTMDAWRKAGLPLSASNPITPQQLFERMQRDEAPVIVDVRLPSEWMALRIGTVLNLPLNRLSDLASQLDPSQPVVTVCNSAYRSSMAVGILERLGFSQPRNLEGGSAAWLAAGFPVVETASSGAGEKTPQKREVHLPERISASELKRLLVDLPNTFDVVDIRPREHFLDYHLPGAVNVDVNDLMYNPKYLVGVGALIIVDRDGSIAMAAGGVLSQKTKRPIKVLYRGLEAYWLESEGKTGGTMPPTVLPETPGPAVPAASVPSAPQPPAKPKKKSAGC